MKPYVDDTDFEVRRQHYRHMLQSAQANIELRRDGEGFWHGGAGFASRLATLAGRLLALVRRQATVARPGVPSPGFPCPEAVPCE